MCIHSDPPDPMFRRGMPSTRNAVCVRVVADTEARGPVSPSRPDPRSALLHAFERSPALQALRPLGLPVTHREATHHENIQ
jgi:hypothetical protein